MITYEKYTEALATVKTYHQQIHRLHMTTSKLSPEELAAPLGSLKLPTRAINLLNHMQIRTLYDLLEFCSSFGIRSFKKSMGKKTFTQLDEFLETYGCDFF